MTAWFPPLDAALGGIGDAITGVTDTAGDAAGGFVGGLFGPLGSWLFQLVALGMVAWLVAQTL